MAQDKCLLVVIRLLLSLCFMVKRFLIGESPKKHLKSRSGSGRGKGALSWRRWFIEGPLQKRVVWSAGSHHACTNCRLLQQLCKQKVGSSSVLEGPLRQCKLWLNPGRAFGPGLGRRRDLRCSLSGLDSGWGPQPIWARLVAFYFCNNGRRKFRLEEYQRQDGSGQYLLQTDHLPLRGVPEHLRHRYCLTTSLEIVTVKVNQERRIAERRGEKPYPRRR